MKINSIQYLRAIAAILVVYCHAIDSQSDFGVSFQQNFYFLRDFGAIGVDLFFVISGFIISYVSSNLPGGIRGTGIFLKKRFTRINPSYYLVTIIALAFRYISKPNTIFPTHEVIKSLTIVPLADTGHVFWKPVLYTGWTLAFEWLFYIAYAILLLFSVKRKDFLLILILGILTLAGFLMPAKNIQYTFITNPIIWEFCMGVCIAEIYKTKKIKTPLAIVCLAAGLSFYIYLILYGYQNAGDSTATLAAENSWIRVLLWGIPSAFIVFGLVFIEKNNAFSFKNTKILLLGEASYAVYLIHPICYSFFAIVTRKVPGLQRYLPPDLYIAVTLIIATFIGVLYYSIVEKRLNLLFKESKKEPQKVAGYQI